MHWVILKMFLKIVFFSYSALLHTCWRPRLGSHSIMTLSSEFECITGSQLPLTWLISSKSNPAPSNCLWAPQPDDRPRMSPDYLHHVMHHKLLNDCYGDQAFLCRVNEIISMLANDLFIAIFMSLTWCFNEFQPCQPDLLMISIIDTRSEISDVALNWNINWCSLVWAGTWCDLWHIWTITSHLLPPWPELSLANHSGMSENNKHAFRASLRTLVLSHPRP